MPLELASALKPEWIVNLLKDIVTIRSNRKKKISDEVYSVTSVDPFWLAERYIEPYVQETNPADDDEDSPSPAARVGEFRVWLSLFLQKPFQRKDGRHVLFLLADAGMGKTTAMVMLYLTHIGDFWPSSLTFRLMKVGPDIIAQTAEIEDRENTVLLLDALDEDRSALGDVEKRIGDILRVTRRFRQVVITCRSQFFPAVEHGDSVRASYEKVGKFEISGFVCKLLYLSPFSDRQVLDYLEKLYVPGSDTFCRAYDLVGAIENLRIRPLILSYVEDLLDDSESELGDIISIYGRLVQKWVEREVRKLGDLGVTIRPRELTAICQDLALVMLVSSRDSLSAEEIRELLSPDVLEVIKPVDIGGRSLLNRRSDSSFRFAHQTIKEFLAFRKAVDATGLLNRVPPRSEMINSLLQAMIEKDPKVPLSALVNLRKNLQDVDLRHIDLREAGLDRGDLERANLEGAKLDGANLVRAHLAEANLCTVSLDGVIAEGIDLSRARLDNARGVGVDFEEANLFRASLIGASLGDVRFVRSNLSWADFDEAELPDADLNNATAIGVRFAGANMSGANLRDGNFEGGIFEGAVLVATVFAGSRLKGSSFARAELSRADFRSADLVEADFDGASLDGVCLDGADLSGANLTGTEGLKQHHIERAAGNTQTRLPQRLSVPEHWQPRDRKAEPIQDIPADAL